ncbi:hypothetical protein BS50DRAFT_76904 [Corynespora cassiicola Philippines]|uniref:Uncharacterized protein n=1 Tax=Corynespora cassiicola Philippines TaxID=1448308 RepID=A0A2T2NGJ0_CORCC|nr:hypothetical protein BS50DRAFT_76904 [Corynespora cassiicola Philippines]
MGDAVRWAAMRSVLCFTSRAPPPPWARPAQRGARHQRGRPREGGGRDLRWLLWRSGALALWRSMALLVRICDATGDGGDPNAAMPAMPPCRQARHPCDSRPVRSLPVAASPSQSVPVSPGQSQSQPQPPPPAPGPHDKGTRKPPPSLQTSPRAPTTTASASRPCLPSPSPAAILGVLASSHALATQFDLDLCPNPVPSLLCTAPRSTPPATSLHCPVSPVGAAPCPPLLVPLCIAHRCRTSALSASSGVHRPSTLRPLIAPSLVNHLARAPATVARRPLRCPRPRPPSND